MRCLRTDHEHDDQACAGDLGPRTMTITPRPVQLVIAPPPGPRRRLGRLLLRCRCRPPLALGRALSQPSIALLAAHGVALGRASRHARCRCRPACSHCAPPVVWTGQPGVNLSRSWAMQRALHGNVEVLKGTQGVWTAYLGAPVPLVLGHAGGLSCGLSVPARRVPTSVHAAPHPVRRSVGLALTLSPVVNKDPVD